MPSASVRVSSRPSNPWNRASGLRAITRWRCNKRWRRVAERVQATDVPVPAPDPVMLAIEKLVKHYPIKTGAFRTEQVRAVDGVSFSVRRGETLGLVGESGCGKSTLGRVALRLEPPTSGAVRYGDHDLTRLRVGPLRHLRPKLQLVFQD